VWKLSAKSAPRFDKIFS